MKAVIMAGGQGSRLRSVSGALPKPMVPVLGKPILQYQIENLKASGITEIVLVIGYLGEAIRSYFGDGSKFGVRIRYFEEDHPMGTAGALYYLKEALSDDFLLLMGDLMLDVDFARFAAFHKRCGGLVSLFVHPNAHPYDSDIIVTDTVGSLAEYDKAHCGALRGEKGQDSEGVRAESTRTEAQAPLLERGYAEKHARVLSVLGKKDARPEYYRNQVNAGIYMLSEAALLRLKEPRRAEEIEAELALCKGRAAGLSEEEEKRIRKTGKIDLDRDLIRPLIEEGLVYAYRSTEYVKDMGTPDRYESVTEDLRGGIAASRNLSRKQKCIFLDRDGTINELNGFVKSPEALRLFPWAAEAIGSINRSEYLCIAATNQPVIARGECSFEALDQIHAKMETELGRVGAYLDGIYFCPHHPDRGFLSEVEALKFDCRCRKPKPGMLLSAAMRYHIDLSASYMVGDSPQDIACGKAAGTKTVLLSETETAFPEGERPDAVCRSLKEAAELILSGRI